MTRARPLPCSYTGVDMRASGLALGTIIIVLGTAGISVGQDPGLALPPKVGSPSATPTPLPNASSSTSSSAQQVLGRWRARGRHRRLGAFAGTIDVYPTTAGLRYDRTVRYQNDPTTPEVER